ncbi:MAG: hypothetical protein J5632_05490 [Bacteroidales bacterium]|nr:hypothetical protein [Bacteroidales bacterium]
MKNSLLIAAMLLASCFVAGAQKYAPHEQWPFIYEDFAKGEFIMEDGTRVALDAANIAVTDGRLYFIERDTLKQSVKLASLARIAGDDYMLVHGRLMKILRRTEHGAVLFDTPVNHEAMTRSDVGYGMKSSVSATEKRAIIEGSNGATLSLRMVQQPLEYLKAQKNAGAELALKPVKYVYLNGGNLSRALKGDVKQFGWVDKKKLDAFWKQNKVKYTDDDSLAALVEFLASQEN